MKLGPYDLDSIVAGECASLMAAMPEGYIDLTVTSPPYNNLREYQGYVFDFEAIARQLWRVTKPGGVVVWVVGDATINGSETGTSFRQALRFKELGFNLHDTMIYDKDGFRYPQDALYHQVFEYMFVFSKGKPSTLNLLHDRKNSTAGEWRPTTYKRERDGKRSYRKGVTQTTFGKRFNIWRYNGGPYRTTKDNFAFEHPAIFPEALARDHILSWSNPGDIVLDPMVGSGTTCKMAKELGRHWLGFDISPEYVEIARQRVGLAKTPLFIA